MTSCSIKLNNVSIGCVFNNIIINHLIYADDLVIISPSSAGLKTLLNICESFGEENSILFNANKSAIMLFKSRSMSLFKIPDFKLNNNHIEIVHDFEYLGHFI